MIKNQTPSLAIIIALNLLLIWGVWQWGWTPFVVFYLFWLETLIIAFFNTLKIIFCRGDEYEQRLELSTHPFAVIHVRYGSHIFKALTYFITRLFIFFFYLLFIVVFIGLVMLNKSGSTQVIQTLFFYNTTFNIALLGFILNQALQFIFNFILDDEYKKTHPSDFAAIFDGRQLIIHIAVVLGGVFGGFFGGPFSDHPSSNQMALYLFVISIFCSVKIGYEVLKYKGVTMNMQKRSDLLPASPKEWS
jgi:hypothetical protein